MSDNIQDPTEQIDVGKEARRADAQLPVSIGNQQMPLDIAIRSTALSIAGRFIGDTAIKDAAYYQALKLDNKVGPSADLNLLLNYALYLERYLWGEWSKDIAGEAMEKTLTELDDAIREGKLDEDLVNLGGDDNPDRPTSG